MSYPTADERVTTAHQVTLAGLLAERAALREQVAGVVAERDAVVELMHDRERDLGYEFKRANAAEGQLEARGLELAEARDEVARLRRVIGAARTALHDSDGGDPDAILALEVGGWWTPPTVTWTTPEASA
jgi:hypothetical protein